MRRLTRADARTAESSKPVPVYGEVDARPPDVALFVWTTPALTHVR